MPTSDPGTPVSAPPPSPSWQWPESVWRGHVEAVRAGRALTPARWPGGARAAVALSFDSDHETISLRDGETSPGRLAQGEYGARVGAVRIRELLRRRGVPATFFMPHGSRPCSTPTRHAATPRTVTRSRCTAGSTSATPCWPPRTSAT